MGSPLSPILADLVIQDLEKNIFQNLITHIPVYYRYVDDIVLAASKNKINDILDSFNAYHERIKFTVDHGDEDCINFLDLKLIYDDGYIIFDLYKKPTNSGRYLNFFSNHPLSQKRGVVTSLVDKVLFLSHPKFQQKNMESLISSLLNNGYPLQMLFKIIQDRIIILSNKYNFEIINNMDQNFDDESTKKTNYFIIPFLKKTSNKFKGILKKYNLQPVYKPLNSLNKFITLGKDKISKDDQSGVVYKIDCKECNNTYVGQTKRKLKTRLKEHINDIKKPVESLSVISNHQISDGHVMDWNNTEILDFEQSFFKRSISEMIYIKMHTDTLNKQSDTDRFPDVYLPLLKQ